ncbi:MAG: hypothetical protein ACI4T5_06880 [Prevotella sp.]
MKNCIKIAIAALILCSGLALQVNAKNKVAPRYLFGFSASFADSTVYFTDIQKVDSTWIDSKTKFLLGREEYASQLKGYFNSIKMPNRTCVVLFGKDLKKAEKKLKKLKETYTVKAKGGYDVRYLTKADFEFAPVYMGIEDEQPVEKPKKEKKAPKEKKPNKERKQRR